ncbi:carboxypeptidase-like regulatory domain-containing protein [Cetobacterium sp.]|uniref:carboxypeptidase-like regulatory domain-containing protein n=1 Tax=Cetobacterium sp. TaxID=2071632 RepID=UPI003F2A1F5D
MLKKLFLFCFLLPYTLLFSIEDLSLEQLETLRDRGAISLDDYEFLKDELEGRLEEKHSFTLFVNRNQITNNFPIVYKNDKTFISLQEYFKNINYRNFTFTNNILDMTIGEELANIMINFNTLKITGNERTNFEKNDFYFAGDELFLESNLFSDIFLNAIDIDYSSTRISMSTKYTIPNEINRLIKIQEGKLNDDRNLTNFYYTNSRELFNLGYMRFNLEKTFSKTDDVKGDDWDGYLEYQGSFLYGELTTEYNLKDGEFTGANLYYPNLPYNHYVEIYGDKNSDGRWNKSILFQKDKGYYEDGKQFVIRENVPIGSRVELVYLGATIDIGYEENGVVEFRNSELKNDREYLLRIHTKDGRRLTQIIKTNDDFNQQNPGEFQYRFFGTETNLDNRNNYDTSIYYGVTDNFTVGANYFKTYEQINNKNTYIERAGGELIYSDLFKSNAYSIVLKGEELLSDEDFERKHTFEGLAQMKFQKFKIRYEEAHFSDYYDEKSSRRATLEYNPSSYLSFDYSYVWIDEWESGKSEGSEISAEIAKSFSSLLTTLQFERDLNDENRYSLNLYYTGYRDYSVKWSNSITERGGDFESTISLFNRARQNGLDYSFEISYNEQDKEKFTFRVNIDYDNWFKFDMNSKDSGDYDISIGLDRVVDLKNITKPLDSLDTSRVKVITYLDTNNNNQFDKTENYIGDVEVEIDGIKKVTSYSEPTYFFGVPNNILYNLNPIVKRPSYDIVNSKFSLKGKGGGDIEVLIPIKPLFSVAGSIMIEDSTLNSIDIYEGLVVKIFDSNNKLISTMLPDFTGYFDISGLNSGQYKVEVSSFKDSSIKQLTTDVDIIYSNLKGNILELNFILKNNQFEIVKAF